MPRIRMLILLLLLCRGSMLLGQVAPMPLDLQIQRGVAFAAPHGDPLTLDIYRPQHTDAPTAVILAIHGGSWIGGSRGDLRPLAEALAARGYAVVAPDYRLAPEFTFPAQLDDVRAAARWVAAHAEDNHWTTARLFTLGISGGGQLAALLALQPQADQPAPIGVITISGPMDFTSAIPSMQAKIVLKLYLGVSREVNPGRYVDASPITHITPAAPPFLLLHGTADPLVPFSQAERMAAALRAAHVPVTLHPLRNVGHSTPPLDSPLGREIVETLCNFIGKL